ncbi:MAG TPA: hypothetical protein VJZ06_02680, partial [Mobilitalea sp.]|nr:hypothetical protein [Mobilitalea sp.]
EANLVTFMEADVKLLVLGAKDWELSSAEQVLNMVAEYKDIIYLFNFLDGRQYQHAMRCMDKSICYRIPYAPDPFSNTKDSRGQELFMELDRLATLKVKD